MSDFKEKMNRQEHIIDLSHKINAAIPTWPTVEPFCCTVKVDYDQGVHAATYTLSASTGTHIDSPAHFIKNARTIDELTLQELVAPACVINVKDYVKNNHDYTITVEDIVHWEKLYGSIQPMSIVLVYTGWCKRWPDITAYRNMDLQGIMHFPGISPEAARLLLNRNVVGIGIDTFSPDPGISQRFPVHHLLLGADKYIIENLSANLELLPPTGALVYSLPIHIKNGPEAPARIIARVPLLTN